MRCGVVDGPGDEDAAGVVRGLGERGGREAVMDPDRLDAQEGRLRADETRQPGAVGSPCRPRTSGLPTRLLVQSRLTRGMVQPRLSSGAISPSARIVGISVPEVMVRSVEAARADGFGDLVLATADLDVEVDLHRVERRLVKASSASSSVSGSVARRAAAQSWATRIGPEPFGGAGWRGAPVRAVGEVLGRAQDVELDRVDAGLDGGVEALDRVAGDDPVRPLVPDAQHGA